MKRIKVTSDVITSRGIFKTGDTPEIEDHEADACIKQGKAELVSAGAPDPPKPAMPPNLIEKSGHETASPKKP